MCGITGILHFDYNRRVNDITLKKMTRVVSHRGPDGEGYCISKNVGMGHRRLSIIDLITGSQPMIDKESDLIIVFNGEIYNYVELKDELLSYGYVFKTKSDTEVILKAYDKWGIDCQKKLNGMWAFALWDNKTKKLLLSRDRIGEKPLHYAIWDNSLIFASEIRSIFEYGIPKTPLIELTEIYLFKNHIPAPYTFFKNIKKLLPGHFLVAESGNISIRKYWDMPRLDENNMLNNKKEIYSNFEYLLKDAVKIRMRSDVPFGAFLSGGLDSSSIVTIMSEMYDSRVKTFNMRVKNKKFDESVLANKLSIKLDTDHYIVDVSPNDIESTLNNIVNYYYEPFGDSSAIPTEHICKFASKKVKMVLTGDGGDEVLSGYRSYSDVKFAKYYQNIPILLRKNAPSLIHRISKIFTGSLRYKFNRIEDLISISNIPFEIRGMNTGLYSNFNLIKQLTKNIPGVVNIEDYNEDIMKKIPYKDEFYKLMYLHFKYSLPDDFLVKVDRMSMAFSLETRIPFLDYRLIEYMALVDKNVKMQGFERKSILRRTIGKKLPESILKGRKKGFSVPLRIWFRDKRYQHVTNSILNDNIGLNIIALKEILTKHKNGEYDYGNIIWMIMVLQNTMRKVNRTK